MSVQTQWLRPVVRLTLAGLLGAAVLLSSAAPLPVHARATTPPTLRLDYYAYTPGDPVLGLWRLDPAQVGETRGFPVGELQLLTLVQANLVTLKPNGVPSFGLATWKVSKNKRVYTFTIRKNARFANGHPVTAQDAAFSLRRSLAPHAVVSIAKIYLGFGGLIQGGAAYSNKGKQLRGVTILDRRTLRITLSKPAAYFLVMLSYPSLDILDPTQVTGKSGSANPLAHLQDTYMTNTCIANQGAGPFQFVCHDRHSNPHSFYSGNTPSYTLVPNQYYYGQRPHIRIELPRILKRHGLDERTEEYKLYLEGRLDVSGIPHAFLKQWAGKSNQYHIYPAPAMHYLLPNVHLAPFDNIHCRLAVAYAIDRRELASSAGNGATIPSYTVVPRGMLGSDGGNGFPHLNLKREKAELGRCPGRALPISFKYPQGNLEEEAIGPMLRKAGLNVKDEPLTLSDWFNVIGSRLSMITTNTQLVYDQWIADYPDPQDYCTYLLRSGQPGNVGGWHSVDYDRLVDKADATSNSKSRAALYLRAQHFALRQGAMITVTQGLATFLIRSAVHGLVDGPAYPLPIARDDDWAKVSIGKH